MLTRSSVGAVLAAGWALIAAVIIALFVQKSDGNSALGAFIWTGLAIVSSLCVLVTVVALLVLVFGSDDRFLNSVATSSHPYILGLAGLIGLTFAFHGIDVESTNFSQEEQRGTSSLPEQSRFSETVIDNPDYTVRRVIVGESAEAYRIAATVISKSEAPLILDRARFGYSSTEPGCGIPGGGSTSLGFALVQDVYVRGTQVDRANVLSKDGPLAGFTTPAESAGLRADACGNITEFAIEIPVTMNLEPLGIVDLSIEIPKTLRIVVADRANMRDALRVIRPRGAAASVNYTGSDSYACVFPPIEYGLSQEVLRLSCPRG